MPIKFSKLAMKGIEESASVVALYNDNSTGSPKITNCIIDIDDFISKDYYDTQDDNIVHKSDPEDIYGNKTFTSSKTTVNGVLEVNGNITTGGIIQGTSDKALKDNNGNLIINTYATKSELQQKSTFTLFHDEMFDHQLNDPSWLRADEGDWQSGTTYSNAYNHLVSDISGKTLQTKKIYNSSNVSITGVVNNYKGLLEGFAGTTTFATHNVKAPESSFEYVIKCKIATLAATKSIIQPSVKYKGIILRVVNATTGQVNVWVGTGTAYTIQNVNTNCPMPANNTWIWYKLAWDGSTFTVSSSSDGVTYTEGLSQALATPPDWATSATQALGGCSFESAPFTNGTIDLNECYLKIDDEMYWQGCNYDTLSYYEASDGHLIATSNSETAINNLYEAGEASWYYMIDTQNTRFKLPKVKNRKLVESYDDGSNWYRLYSDKWVEQGGYYTNSTDSWITQSLRIPMKDTNYTVSIERSKKTDTADPGTGGIDRRSIFTNGYKTTEFKMWGYWASYPCSWEVKGYADVKVPNFGENYHYFYVGQFTGTALEQTAGLNIELFNGKADKSLRNVPPNFDYVVKCKKPTILDPTWYRLYRSGWIEQGGTIAANVGTSGTITFPLQMRDTTYNCQCSVAFTAASNYFTLNPTSKTITTISWFKSNTAVEGSWEIRGYAADVSYNEEGESTYVFGDTYKTYFYRNMNLDYDNAVGPMTAPDMVAYTIPKAGVIVGYIDPNDNSLSTVTINGHVVWGARGTQAPVHINVEKDDVFACVSNPSPATNNQLWFVPYKEDEQSNDTLITNIMNAIYPIGSIYIGTTANCPIASIVGTWQKIDGDLVLQSSSTVHTAGTIVEPGLPNITGAFTGTDEFRIGPTEGAFTASNPSKSSIGTEYGANNHTINFDASNSSPIYGNSDTVQPHAYIVNVWRRIS